MNWSTRISFFLLIATLLVLLSYSCLKAQSSTGTFDICTWTNTVLPLGTQAKVCDQLGWTVTTWDDVWEDTMSDELNGKPAFFVWIKGQDLNNLLQAKDYITLRCGLPNLELTPYVPQKGKAWMIIKNPDGSLFATQYFDHSCYAMIP